MQLCIYARQRHIENFVLLYRRAQNMRHVDTKIVWRCKQHILWTVCLVFRLWLLDGLISVICTMIIDFLMLWLCTKHGSFCFLVVAWCLVLVAAFFAAVMLCFFCEENVLLNGYFPRKFWLLSSPKCSSSTFSRTETLNIVVTYVMAHMSFLSPIRQYQCADEIYVNFYFMYLGFLFLWNIAGCNYSLYDFFTYDLFKLNSTLHVHASSFQWLIFSSLSCCCLQFAHWVFWWQHWWQFLDDMHIYHA